MKRRTIPAKVDSSETHTKRSLKRRLTAWAKGQKEERDRASKLEAGRQREAKLREPNKLRKATGHLETGLDLLRAVLVSPKLPTHKARDRHDDHDYETSDAARVLAAHAERAVEALCDLARRDNREALGQAMDCGNLLASLVEELTEKRPELMKFVARDKPSMPVRWHRKQSLNKDFSELAKSAQLAEGLFEDPTSVSRGESGFTRHAREVLEEWASIERLGRKACAKLQRKDKAGPYWHRESWSYVRRNGVIITAIPKRELVRGMVDPHYVLWRRILCPTTPDTVTEIWCAAFKLPPPKRNDMEDARQWARHVILPYLKQCYGDDGIAKLEGFKGIARSSRKDDRRTFDAVYVEKLAQAVKPMVRPESKS